MVYVYSMLLTLALLACDEYGDVENVIVSREPTRQIFTPALTVSIDKTELEAEGGSLTLTVTSNTNGWFMSQSGVRATHRQEVVMAW